MANCPGCGAERAPSDNFCGRCGHDLRPQPTWLSSAAPAGECGHCGAPARSGGGYCDECGHRRGAGLDRADLALAGVAAVTDRGHHRRHNEDAIAIGEHATGTIAVVCDGVSTSTQADTAAQAATRTAAERILRELADGASVKHATVTAFRAAFEAAAALVTADNRHNPPSCTYVSAIVTGAGLTVGWVGDSRAYWVPVDGEARALTVDDALPGVDGAPLTRWVGADAEETEIRIEPLDAPGAGTLVVCSDGLSRYLSGPGDLATMIGTGPPDTADRLTRFALDAGGVDNIAIAVLSFPPPDRSGAPT